jgi:hypothetical protein
MPLKRSAGIAGTNPHWSAVVARPGDAAAGAAAVPVSVRTEDWPSRFAVDALSAAALAVPAPARPISTAAAAAIRLVRRVMPDISMISAPWSLVWTLMPFPDRAPL